MRHGSPEEQSVYYSLDVCTEGDFLRKDGTYYDLVDYVWKKPAIKMAAAPAVIIRVFLFLGVARCLQNFDPIGIDCPAVRRFLCALLADSYGAPSFKGPP